MQNFSKDLFKNPTKDYRAAPFWAWNGKLEKTILKENIDTFMKMGFGGFHIHSRIGLKTPYLSEEFMDCVKFCNEYGKENDMLTYLYDEDKWPSGYGGGFVTENENYRARYLLFSSEFYPNGHLDRKLPPKGRLTENGNITLLSKYEVTLDDGRLVSYKQLDINAESTENTWYAYEVIGDKLPWFNNAAYVDVLNAEAIEKFIEVTHEKYKASLADEFGKSIPSIFTDEPQYIKMQQLIDGEKGEADLAYTSGMEEDYKATYGYSFLEKLPELIWENADGSLSYVKYHYYNYLSDRFSQNYAKTLGDWCQKENIMLTGHLMYEDNLETQSQCVGDAMRSYPYFGIPGIDVLADLPVYTAAKQAQSVAHQYNKRGVLSELYGVTNWDYDFKHHKLQGDWQAALGITLRVPHLSWLYMGGESKRDYPSPIDAHATWYEKYPIIENHFARVNTVLKRGKADVKIGVLHPIESYWMLIGSKKQTMQKRTTMNEAFCELTRWLIFGLVDFDFLSEGLLPTQNIKVKDGKIQVGEMTYETIVVPKLLTIRQTTIDILDKFQKSGGKIIWIGDVPDYVDGFPSENAHILNAKPIGFDCEALLSSLESYRDIDIKNSYGLRTDCLIYQMRKENNDKWLFVAHGKEENNIDIGAFQQKAGNLLEFSILGNYNVSLLDTMSGDIKEIDYIHKNGKTVFSLLCAEHDSFLLHLAESKEEKVISRNKEQNKKIISEFYLSDINDYHLEEPNTMLLDQAEWRLDEGVWQPKEEILRIDDRIRKILSMRLRTDSFPQPWLTIDENNKEHTVHLKFEITSEIALDAISLAFEGDSDVSISWNDESVTWKAGKHFIDRAINNIPLGSLKKGKNILELTVPFGENTNLEWCYILGDFGVKALGRNSYITEKPKQLAFGDYSSQGLSFYGGNVVYETSFEAEDGTAEIEIPHFIAPLLGVMIDDKEEIPLFMAPYRISLGKLKKGTHTLKLRAYGSRINQFGQVHNCNPNERYFGPKTWRTSDAKWCYEYNLKECGILTAPIVRIYK